MHIRHKNAPLAHYVSSLVIQFYAELRREVPLFVKLVYNHPVCNGVVTARCGAFCVANHTPSPLRSG
jgi:hypothetical protein